MATRRELARNSVGRLSWCERCEAFHLRLGPVDVRLRSGELLTLARDAEDLADSIDGPHESHPKHRLPIDSRSISLRLSCAELAALRELLRPGRERAAREMIDGVAGVTGSIVH